MIHKAGWLEAELKRIAGGYPQKAVSPEFFQVLVAEALLILLERNKPHDIQEKP